MYVHAYYHSLYSDNVQIVLSAIEIAETGNADRGVDQSCIYNFVCMICISVCLCDVSVQCIFMCMIVCLYI